MLSLNENYLKNKFSSTDVDAHVLAHAELLGSCQTGETQYADSLGWLNVDEWANENELAKIEATAARLREEADTFVLIGVGGSNNAARAVLSALGTPDSAHRVVCAGNTLSARELNGVLANLEGHKVVLDCIAKNFETLEPGSSFRLLRQWLVGKVGKEEAAKRIVCCGTPGSPLDELCQKEGYEFTVFPPNVGGRFTALTSVHLLPLAYAGIDIRSLVAGAKAESEILRAQTAKDNLALRYASMRKLAWDAGLRIELLSFFEPCLAGFSKWWEQLFGESEGKDNVALFPAATQYSEELHSLGQYVQSGTHQILETFIDVQKPSAQDSCKLGPTDVADNFSYLDNMDFWDVNKASFTATREAHSSILPCPTIELERLDEYNLGELFYFFMFSCYISAKMLKVNPFDQPGVEAYKQLMFKTLRG